MAAFPQFTTVDEYLRTPELFHHHEYVDGLLLPKPKGTWKHSALQL